MQQEEGTTTEPAQRRRRAVSFPSLLQALDLRHGDIPCRTPPLVSAPRAAPPQGFPPAPRRQPSSLAVATQLRAAQEARTRAGGLTCGDDALDTEGQQQEASCDAGGTCHVLDSRSRRSGLQASAWEAKARGGGWFRRAHALYRTAQGTQTPRPSTLPRKSWVLCGQERGGCSPGFQLSQGLFGAQQVTAGVWGVPLLCLGRVQSLWLRSQEAGGHAGSAAHSRGDPGCVTHLSGPQCSQLAMGGYPRLPSIHSFTRSFVHSFTNFFP